ncbi:MAG TPA: riboflavin synthase [bacterium]|nr:riboflavin synthase [bacterium]HOL66880.1 riboflavin synthase [bacterium]HPP13434.1 riboflavin synthase [bacterium]
MFSGIIEEVGALVGKCFKGSVLQLRIKGEKIGPQLQSGESVAVSGVCLTVEEKDGPTFAVSLSAQTLKETTLGSLKLGEPVNLERALLLSGRLGGHMVTGHVDFQTNVLALQRRGETAIMKLRLPEEHRRYVVKRGCLAVDGVSLTVAEIESGVVSLWLVPYTLSHTTLQFKRTGCPVNVETDIIAKYLANLLKERSA